MSALPFSVPSIERFLAAGLLSSLLSTAVLAWRGKVEDGAAAAPLNAVSHWFWGDEALARDGTDASHTGAGVVTHLAATAFWATFYAWMRSRRDRPGTVDAVTDAALVTAVAAVVDLKLVPERLTPGFEHRLSRPSLTGVYVAVGVGLALGGLLTLRR